MERSKGREKIEMNGERKREIERIKVREEGRKKGRGGGEGERERWKRGGWKSRGK